MTELYTPQLSAFLESLWGTGFLSPGGPDEVARLIGEADIAGQNVLDIGCGAGGIDIALVERHGAGYVTGLDVEDGVLGIARARIAAAGLTDRIGTVKAAPGPLPFGPGTFDVVFSKDSIVHISDKEALMREVARVLRPGGLFIASDWLIGHDGPPSPEMRAYIAKEGLDFGMASPARYLAAMAAAGLVDTSTTSRNAWYARVAREELARLTGPDAAAMAEAVGQDFVDYNTALWALMIPVLDSGEHSPTHIRGRKPA